LTNQETATAALAMDSGQKIRPFVIIALAAQSTHPIMMIPHA